MSAFLQNRNCRFLAGFGLAILLAAPAARGQLVGFPDPHLLTILPMGAQQGTSVEVEITGRHEKAIPRYMFGLDYLRVEASE